MKTTKKSKATPGPSAMPVTGGIAEIDFGITSATSSKKRSSKYPLIDGQEKLVGRIVDLSNKFDAVDGPFKSAKQDLIEAAFPQFFEKNKGRIDVPSSMVGYSEKDEGARVTFKDQFTPGDKEKLYKLLGLEAAAIWFRQSWEIKIDGDVIPSAKTGELIKELREVMHKHGASHAMEIKSGILPNDAFAIKRHSEFDPKMNLEINKIVPQRASVTTKGVK